MKEVSPTSLVRMQSKYDDRELIRVIHRMTPEQRAKVRDRLESFADGGVKAHGLKLMRICYTT